MPRIIEPYVHAFDPDGAAIVAELLISGDYHLQAVVPGAVRAAQLGADRRGLTGPARRAYVIDRAADIADQVDWIMLNDCGRMWAGGREAVVAYLDAEAG